MLKMNYTLYIYTFVTTKPKWNESKWNGRVFINFQLRSVMIEIFFNGLNGRILFLSFANTGPNRAYFNFKISWNIQ